MAQQFPDIPEQDWVIVETDIEWNITEESIDWNEDSMLELPEGIQTSIVNSNEAEQRVDFFVRFPEGYIEPEHTHAGAHAVMIVDGTMTLHGHTLTSGDYLYGQKTPHGPMEYHSEDADYGCLVFATFVGGSPIHEWDENPNR